MKVSGIIVEYNPFHNGHLYHINQTKELTNCDLLVAVCSGNFTQRGQVSIINKFEKAKAALQNGVDLIVELPYIYTVQNASVFGSKAVEILKMLKVDTLVFGSETNNLEELKKMAEFNINIDHLKENMQQGNSFVKSYGLLAGSLYPNDILAVSYLRAIKEDMQAISIKRTNSYHSLDLETISSAKAIREALKNKTNYHLATPLTIDNYIDNSLFYPYLRHILFTHEKEEIQKLFLVNEGIENLLSKNAKENIDYEAFVKTCVNRRYTRARIERTCLNIINYISKQEVTNLSEMNYVRILGFNNKGQEYLHNLKKTSPVKLVSSFKQIPNDYRQIEWKVAQTYSLATNNQDYLKRELMGPVIVD